jgi:transposase InsO family protein
MIHHSDQGVQYAAAAYVAALREHDILISMADVGVAWQNTLHLSTFDEHTSLVTIEDAKRLGDNPVFFSLHLG